ncbi:FadR family transcriptional regulator [Hoeflea sp. G2-23]|uniref:FadR family transcriptional regulator n=1 Tax=Hoeflea algicola TaxID=2983763 RepID=A0ABT3ZCX9_9HYPH|nr:FadR/GntR family transcriptional regulator [Hoeflea algicola]MCY0149653.1 FadR family transcriptional regulator [Hoeflea algicola]
MDDKPRKSLKPRKSDPRSTPLKVRARPIVRPVRLSDQIMNTLRKDIETGRTAPGSRLPTEKELTETFNVSRTVIREAISRLQSDGLVVARQGAGIFIADPREVARSFRLSLVDTEKQTSIREAYELRIGIESEASALAAQRHTKSDIVQLEKTLDKLLTSADNFDRGVEADVNFHHLIAQISKNKAMLRFQEFLASMLVESVKIARDNSARQEGMTESVNEEHVRIFHAIASGNSDDARQFSRLHLISALNRLQIK